MIERKESKERKKEREREEEKVTKNRSMFVILKNYYLISRLKNLKVFLLFKY